MSDKVDRKEPWYCENCSCLGHGYQWKEWHKLPPGWFRCDMTVNGEAYAGVVCSEECMREMDGKLEQS